MTAAAPSLVCVLVAFVAAAAGFAFAAALGRGRLAAEADRAASDRERALDETRAAGEALVGELRARRDAADIERDRAAAACAEAQGALAAEGARLADARAELAATRDQFSAERANLLEQVGQKIEAAAAAAFTTANGTLLASAASRDELARSATLGGVESITKKLGSDVGALAALVSQLDHGRLEQAKVLETTLAGLTARTHELRGAIDETRASTQTLAAALRDTRVRGRWGEVQLRRLVELAGLVEHVDFHEQRGNEAGLRPDLVVRLPGAKSVAVDAKVPLDRYLEATEATDPVEQQRLLRESAAALRTHVRELVRRKYDVDGAGFTILFVPIESVMAAALAVEPKLFDEGLEAGIFIATPLTLLVYLRCFAHAWAQHRQERNADEIVKLAHELIERLGVFGERFADVGKSLGRGVEAFNEAVGSFDRRVVVSAAKIAKLSGKAPPPGAPPELALAPRALEGLGNLRRIGGRDDADAASA